MMLRRFYFGAAVFFAVAAATPALAEDCGFPPTGQPALPDGDNATREIINEAVQAVRDHSIIVNQHLNCLQSRRDELFLNMTREQQDRWIADYNVIIDRLEELETNLNIQIRAFNTKTS